LPQLAAAQLSWCRRRRSSCAEAELVSTLDQATIPSNIAIVTERIIILLCGLEDRFWVQNLDSARETKRMPAPLR
jgi:hypothetical protein